MKPRTEEDFSDVITGLVFDTDDIVAVPNNEGIYCNANVNNDLQYAASFKTIDKYDCTWVEIFRIKRNGEVFTIYGIWSAINMGEGPTNDVIMLKASEMVSAHL